MGGWRTNSQPLRDDIMDLPPARREITPGAIVAKPSGSTEDFWVKRDPHSGTFAVRGLAWQRSVLRVLWMGCSLGVILYSISVLSHVAWMGTIGVRCMFGTKVEEEIPSDYVWHDARPRVGDELL